MRLALIVGLLLLTGSEARGSKGLADLYTSVPQLVGSAPDPELAAAHRQAKKTLHVFLQRLERRSPADFAFGVQLMVGQGTERESVWLRNVTRRGKNLVGVVDGTPLFHPTLQEGESLEVPLEDVTDWMILERTIHGERMTGGYTIQLLEQRELRGVVPGYVATSAWSDVPARID